MYAVGKHALPLLAGSQMEPYFRCYMGLIEVLAQPSTTSDEVIIEVFKYTFGFLKSMARNGLSAVDEAEPMPYIKKMMFYIANSPSPTVLQQTLRDTFDVQDVDGVRIESAGRLIQEDDLLEALGQTLGQLLEVMEFITSDFRKICASNAELHSTIVPRLRQVSLQLKAIGLTTHADTILDQHQLLQEMSLRDEPASQTELIDFGGALVVVKESLEHKLKHGLSAQGDSIDYDLDAAVMAQTARCLSDMKTSINREFTRKELLLFVEELQASDTATLTQIRPLYRAATLVEDDQLQQTMMAWEQGDWPAREVLLHCAEKLLGEIPEHGYAEQAAMDMEQVLSVLGLMEGKETESEVLDNCAGYIRDSIAQGGLLNDAGMACFAEAIAALEHYMERRTADPLGNSDEHLDRAEARARMLSSFVEQRSQLGSSDDNVLDFDSAPMEEVELDDLDLTELPALEDEYHEPVQEQELVQEQEPVQDREPVQDQEHREDLPADGTNVVALVPEAAEAKESTESAEINEDNGPLADAGAHWRDALEFWGSAEIERGPDAPQENPDADVDEELVEIFVEEARKYIRRLDDALPAYVADLDNETPIMEIRAIFHTMKGSARTIELMEFGEFMFDMEKVFNGQRDGYISGSPEIAELVGVVAARMKELIGKMLERVPLYTADFAIPHTIAAAISEKRFDADGLRVACDELPAAEAAPVDELEDALTAPAIEPQEPQAADSQLETTDEAELWARGEATDILAYVLGKLQGADSNESSEVGPASKLLHALVPALVELRDGDFLLLENSTLAYFLDLPVIEQLASNAVFGLVDNGQGEFFKFPLSNQVIADLKSYLDLLLEGDDEIKSEAVVHEQVKVFVRNALSLPELEPMTAAPLDSISTEQLNQFAIGELEPFEDGDALAEVVVDADGDSPVAGETETPGEPLSVVESDAEPELVSGSEPVTQVEPPEEGNPPPKPIAVAKPEFVLVPESATEETHPVEDIDEELLDLFVETLDEYLEGIDAAVAQLALGEETGLQRLKNTLHTIKGGANSVGVRNFGTMVHDFESIVADLELDGTAASDKGLEQIYPQVDQMQEAARFVRRQGRDWDAHAAAEEATAEEHDEESDADFAGVPLQAAVAKEDAELEKRADSLRVSTNKIDRLLDTGLEISMTNVRSRHALDAALQDRIEVQGLARRVNDLVDKLSLQLDTEIQAKTETAAEGEDFDPLEMDRITEKQSLAAILREAAYDLHEQSKELGDYIDTAVRETASISRLIEGSQSEMRLLRLVNFSKLGPGFRRLVHQISRKLEKQVEFEITCDEGGLDVGVFEQVKIALEHMLRNSIDHGIDAPEERARLGKSETGKISLVIYRQASEFVIQLLDDGNGMDPEIIRDKAVEKGLINASDLLSEREALRLVFRAGFSTAEEVTDVSGRGVGMDVVHSSITAVGGSIEVQSKPGFYTQFDIRIPASIMVNGALLARIGDEEVAVPLTSLDGSDFRHRDEIHREQGRKSSSIKFRGEDYELRYLGLVRGTLPTPKVDAMPEFVPVLFAHNDRRRIAYYVDSVANAEELVIRSLGAQYTGVPGIAGGSLKPDGQAVLALDLNELIGQIAYADEKYKEVEPEADTSTLIFCVDDSVMMRRTYEKRLESLGYEVVTAVDGEEALDYLSEATRLPDFIFTDLEMPNMNGFDFIANLRRAPVLEDIPTVVVSSRDGEKHREEAERVGATDFMAKGANSAEGMRVMIERHLGQTALAS